MITAEQRYLMASYSRLRTLLAGIALLCYPGYLLAEVLLSETKTEFSATIVEGSCDWTWDQTRLDFLPLTADRIKTGNTLEIKPLTAAIQCNQAITPQLKVTGNTPFSGNEYVFLDGSNTRNVGFMLQVDDGRQQVPSLSNFYSNGMAGNAIKNNIPVSISSAAQANQQTRQIIWVGLVGMNASNLTIPGSFSTTLIFTGLIP